MKEESKTKIRVFVVSVAIALSVGILAALLTKGNISIYGEIKTPPLAPPPWLFPVAWSILYILMGVSSALVYSNARLNPRVARSALFTYAISLFFNFLWSIIFFNLRAYLFAFIWLLALLFLIVKTIVY